MYPSTIRQKLQRGEVLLSTSMFSREAHVAAAVYQTGPDWVWIDQEHSPWGTESIGTICIQGRMAGVAPVIRVPWNDPGDIKKAYDVGAVGVMVPQVDNPEEAATAIKYSKYPPIGERGIAPWFASSLGITQGDVIKQANDETLLILQMESTEAYEKVDETLKLEHFEVLLVGPTDLSASLGVPGDIHHSKVENVMIDMVEKVKGTGKGLATTFGDPEDCRRWIEAGYRMMNVSSVLALGTAGTKRYFAEFREQFA
ncbi:MAG: aldolase/citrate lyase family protein [Dehalococcoidia bacterium]